jgi:arylsulfatase A-like enzyme
MSDRRNLLFIFTDQQRADTMECYGNRVVQTPNLNALARGGIVFQNAYVSQPVCTPSRATIMTGLYPQTHSLVANNMPLNPGLKTIAEMVSGEYLCGYYGKWHLGDEVVPQHGFDRWLSIDDSYRGHYTNRDYLSHMSDYHHFLIDNGIKPDRENLGARVFGRPMTAGLPEELTKAAFVARESARFIRENRDRPFVLYINFFEPHQPYAGPFDDMYSREELATGPHFLQKPPKNASTVHRMMADYFMQSTQEGHDLTMEGGWREIRARYWGNVTLVDRHVGVILRALEESGLVGSTAVVFTSEHGDMLGDHGILHKSVMYEEAIKVPLIVRAPWLDREAGVVKGRREPGRPCADAPGPARRVCPRRAGGREPCAGASR